MVEERHAFTRWQEDAAEMKEEADASTRSQEAEAGHDSPHHDDAAGSSAAGGVRSGHDQPAGQAGAEGHPEETEQYCEREVELLEEELRESRRDVAVLEKDLREIREKTSGWNAARAAKLSRLESWHSRVMNSIAAAASSPLKDRLEMIAMDLKFLSKD